MPYVNLKITRGAEVTRVAKATLVQGITQLLVDVLGKRPEHIHIVIDEVDPDDWGFAGMLTTDYRAQRPGASAPARPPTADDNADDDGQTR